MDMFVYFRKKYPDMFKDDYFISFGCGDGWLGIIEEVFERIKGKGAKIIQLKEKFGGLRIYTDYAVDYRIDLTKDGVVGFKDNKMVEKEIPGAEPLINFVDYTKVNYEVEEAGVYYYRPGNDKFYQLAGYLKEVEVEDKEFIKGRLAQLTGLVDAEPIEEEKIDDVIDWAEDESFKTCEGCGSKEDVTVEGGWIKTLCKKCREKPHWWDGDNDEKASTELVDELRPYVDQILEGLDLSDILVTDESRLFTLVHGDFKKIEELKGKLEVDVINGDYLFQVAERLKKKENSAGEFTGSG